MLRGIIILLALILLGLQYRLWVGPGSLAEVARLQQRIHSQRSDNEQLALRNERLAGEVHSLKNDLAAVEARARQELGMIRRGEAFYLVVESQAAP